MTSRVCGTNSSTLELDTPCRLTGRVDVEPVEGPSVQAGGILKLTSRVCGTNSSTLDRDTPCRLTGGVDFEPVFGPSVEAGGAVAQMIYHLQLLGTRGVNTPKLGLILQS